MTGPANRQLPELVRRYVERALPEGEPLPRRLRLTQVGEMRQKPDGRWLPFTAVQEFEVADIAFSWRARFPIVPLVWLSVLDRYDESEGELAVRLWGALTVSRARGPEVDRGEASRYLAELAWVPPAMVANEALEWHELGGGTVEVAAGVGAERLAVQLHFDNAGDITGVYAPARPRRDGKRTIDTPFAGEFSEYRTLAGIRIPTRAEVRWQLPEGPFTYFHGTVTSLVIVGDARPTDAEAP
jgi:hypothetical protein